MEPRKILIVRLGALGDVIHAVPAQQALRRRFPQAEMHWLVEPAYRPLLESVEGLDKVWTADLGLWRKGSSWAGDLRAVLRGLRKQRFDLAFDFQGLLKSASLARLTRPSQLLGFRPERFKEWGIQFFYSRLADGEADLARHVIDSNLHMASLVLGDSAFPGSRPSQASACEAEHRPGPTADGDADSETGFAASSHPSPFVGGWSADPYLPLRLPEADLRYVDRQLKEAGIARPPVLLNPGAGWETKLWPPREFARLGRAIEEQLRLPVVYTWGPGEEGLIEQIRAETAPHPVRTFPTTILQLAALCRRARLFVGGDTGPLHLAAGLGIPVAAVMGPTTAARNGPFHPADEVVQNQLHCSDCYKRNCDVYFCMNVPHWEVLRAVVRRLRRAGWEPGAGSKAVPARRPSGVVRDREGQP